VANSQKYDRRVMRLFDGYVHGQSSRRQFLDGTAKITASATTAAASTKAPLMLHHGELDERVNASWPKFEEALQAAGANYVAYEYADANHGFHNDTTPRYDENAAEPSWQRSTDFFARHLDLGD
jgi:dienelactone hydrolase